MEQLHVCIINLFLIQSQIMNYDKKTKSKDLTKSKFDLTSFFNLNLNFVKIYQKNIYLEYFNTYFSKIKKYNNKYIQVNNMFSTKIIICSDYELLQNNQISKCKVSNKKDGIICSDSINLEANHTN